jgi:hypothetical protein
MTYGTPAQPTPCPFYRLFSGAPTKPAARDKKNFSAMIAERMIAMAPMPLIFHDHASRESQQRRRSPKKSAGSTSSCAS